MISPRHFYFNILYGSGKYILEYAKKLGDPIFEEARSALRVAQRILNLALETRDPLDRDKLFREAFDSLFHAVRIAAMTYLSTEVARWRLLRRMLSELYNRQFKEFIDVLHIEYFYNGRHLREGVEEELNKWYRRIREFIDNLEREIKKRMYS